MQSEIRTHENREPVKPFPKLMQSTYDKAVVFFSSEMVGIVVHVSGSLTVNFIGEFSNEWRMDVFRDFKESVLLSN